MYFLLDPDFVEEKKSRHNFDLDHVTFLLKVAPQAREQRQCRSCQQFLGHPFPVQSGMTYPDPKNYASTQLPEGVGKMSFSDEILVSG